MKRLDSYAIPLVAMVMAMTAATADLSSEIYMPALPQVYKFYHTNNLYVQLTVTLNLLAIALAGPVYGTLSDSFGRRKLLLGGMSLFTLASFACFFPHHLYVFIALRILQGIGAAVALITSIAVIDDLYQGREAARIMSFTGMFYALGSSLGPIIGSNVATFWGWHYNFGVLTLFGLIVVISIYVKVPESLPPEKRQVFAPRTVIKDYLHLLAHKKFLIFMLIHSLTLGGFWGLWACEPDIFVTYLGVPQQHYGYLITMGVITFILGSLYNQRMLKKWSIHKLLGLGIAFYILGGLNLLLTTQFFPTSAIIQRCAILFASFGLSLIATNSLTLALESLRSSTGAASALSSSVEMIVGAITSYLATAFATGTMIPIAIILLIIGWASFFLLRVESHKKTHPTDLPAH